jgi:thymidine kinase
MFSGKTEELMRRLRRARIARLKTEIFKPNIDTRYSEEHIVSHDSNAIPSSSVPSSGNILLLSAGADVIGIDEAQFFDDGLPYVCERLAKQGIRVIVAGLDLDYRGKPFGSMPHLMAMADYVTKVHAICLHCGDLAHHSHRIADEIEQVFVGEKESYIPLCRSCFNKELLRKDPG